MPRGVQSLSFLSTGRQSLSSELDRLIHLPALGATRSIDIGVVGVDITTAATAKNAVLGRGWFETPPAKLSVDSHSGQAGHCDNDVGEDEIMNRHLIRSICSGRGERR